MSKASALACLRVVLALGLAAAAVSKLGWLLGGSPSPSKEGYSAVVGIEVLLALGLSFKRTVPASAVAITFGFMGAALMNIVSGAPTRTCYCMGEAYLASGRALMWQGAFIAGAGVLVSTDGTATLSRERKDGE